MFILKRHIGQVDVWYEPARASMLVMNTVRIVVFFKKPYNNGQQRIRFLISTNYRCDIK